MLDVSVPTTYVKQKSPPSFTFKTTHFCFCFFGMNHDRIYQYAIIQLALHSLHSLANLSRYTLKKKKMGGRGKGRRERRKQKRSRKRQKRHQRVAHHKKREIRNEKSVNVVAGRFRFVSARSTAGFQIAGQKRY